MGGGVSILLYVLILSFWICKIECILPKNKITISGNGYQGVTIAISQKLSEDQPYIEQLQVGVILNIKAE